MPAAPSSPIPVGLGQLAGCDPACPDELPDLLARLSRLPDRAAAGAAVTRCRMS